MLSVLEPMPTSILFTAAALYLLGVLLILGAIALVAGTLNNRARTRRMLREFEEKHPPGSSQPEDLRRAG